MSELQFREEILDHGYLTLVESWGSDERIVEAARMSTGKGFLGWGPKGWECSHTGCDWKTDQVERTSTTCGNGHDGDMRGLPGDEKLLRYLYENKHATPFEMGGIVVEVMAPIFVFREWHRHRTQSYNEMSARYTPLPNVNHVPTVERLMLGGGHLTKQAGTIAGAEVLTPEAAEEDQRELEEEWVRQEAFYQRRMKRGVPKELARTHLGTGRYSRMRASANLRNWLAFMTLRSATAAQWEIRQYSDALGRLVGASFPRTHALFAEGKK